MPKLTTAAFAALLTACAGLGWGWADESRIASDAAARASREVSDAQAEAESVRAAFEFLNDFGTAIAKMSQYCREKEGTTLAVVDFKFKPDGSPDQAQFKCGARRQST